MLSCINKHVSKQYERVYICVCVCVCVYSKEYLLEIPMPDIYDKLISIDKEFIVSPYVLAVLNSLHQRL